MRTKRQDPRAGFAKTLASGRATIHDSIKLPVLLIALLLCSRPSSATQSASSTSTASWYGEKHRGKLMANGKKFNPDRLTAASWFYPLGTKVLVTSSTSSRRSVVVTITDRGPALDLVRSGRTIDLSHAAFKQLSTPSRGLVAVKVKPVRYASEPNFP